VRRQTTEIEYKGHSYSFVISEVGNITNEEGKIPISISYVDSFYSFKNIETEKCMAKISLSEQTVFEKFFAKRLNFLNRYKIPQ